ncbi:hypothetical protein I6N90_10600 [Paenibacillus sp. GSMTC-2017]|uniref:hypothetical protein n=1 Tax=Paenibacillus sp. GSMTC-2017 TaxID=2794350 RepID=UPI0018DA201A|nr:hypothetical protein [Paenibacillus sp. GSMTC-2017]MBH5318258.1 hypothetical protein [Paenibacillus sp. GSMTC-2017]
MRGSNKMKWKQFCLFFIALMFMIPPVTIASAESAESAELVEAEVVLSPPGWQQIGRSLLYRSGGYFRNEVVYSTGGDLKVCSTRYGNFTLMEYDPGTNRDEVVSSKWISGCEIWEDIGRFVDGDNNRAEFYVITRSAEHPTFITTYD